MVFHGVGVIAPDLLQEGLLGDVPGAGLHEKAHDVEFPGGQAHFTFRPEDAGGQVQLGVAAAEQIHLIALASQEGPDAGQQFPAVEGLGQVVVGAGIQALDAVHHVGFCGEHQDGDGAVVAAQLPGHLITVHAGEHHVQDHQIVDAQLGILEARIAVKSGLHFIAPGAQHGRHGLRQKDFIFN